MDCRSWYPKPTSSTLDGTFRQFIGLLRMHTLVSNSFLLLLVRHLLLLVRHLLLLVRHLLLVAWHLLLVCTDLS